VKIARLQENPGYMAQLQAALQLPNPETVAVDSSTHVVYALESVGWLHQQLMRAAGRHHSTLRVYVCVCVIGLVTSTTLVIT